MRTLTDEFKKHISFKEVWISFILGGVYLYLHFSDVGSFEHYKWVMIQNGPLNTIAYLAAFLVIICIPRIFCYESERKMNQFIGTTKYGKRYTYFSKIVYSLLFCILLVIAIFLIDLIVSGSFFGYSGIFDKATADIIPIGNFNKLYPGINNLEYVMIEYYLMFCGLLYLAGFVMIIASVTGKTALTTVISSGVYVFWVSYNTVWDNSLRGETSELFEFIYRTSFVNFETLSAYFEKFYLDVSFVQKSVLFVTVMTVIEFIIVWFIWRKKSCDC